jgi:hypothetical protein
MLTLPFVFGCQGASVYRSFTPRCELPEHEFPVPNPVELIGIEPTTSSLQSWRSTN